MERINKFYIMIGALIAFGLFFEFAAHADELDQATTITFSAPIDIPGHELSPGTYLFKVPANVGDQNIVEIYNADGTKLDATVQTIPTEREQPKGHTTVTFAEQGSGQPDALLKWFYPGRLTGHQFMYSAREYEQLAHDQHVTVAADREVNSSEAQAGD